VQSSEQQVDAQVTIRPLKATDDLSELTDLLHRAYSKLAHMGLRYVATHQDVDTIRARIEEGECFVAEMDGKVVGTIVFRNPSQTDGCSWYGQPDVASFGQFAVEPDVQGARVGSALLTHVELRAKAFGAAELALDTAEPASHLIELYTRRGYRIVDQVIWDEVNYPSVVMSKSL
jgi:GNAT superfamily N-acetyltransferase